MLTQETCLKRLCLCLFGAYQWHSGKEINIVEMLEIRVQSMGQEEVPSRQGDVLLLMMPGKSLEQKEPGVLIMGCQGRSKRVYM